MTTVPRLNVDDVTVELGGAVVLDSVSLEVPAGQVVGLVGSNGAGKTTLLSAICGDLPMRRGRVAFDGKRLRPDPRKLSRLGIARTKQGDRLGDDRTVLDHLLAATTPPPARTGLGEMLRLVPRAEADEQQLRDRAVQVLREMDLVSVIDAVPGALPYAVSQRVALACALMGNPRLLLLDEPAGGLDRAGVDELGQVIRALVKTPGRDCAVLLIEHHVEMVLTISDAVVVLDQGKVIARGAPDEIRQDADAGDAYFDAD